MASRIKREVMAGIRARYDDLRDMTEAEMCAAVLLLPEWIRQSLAQGPYRDRYSCGVCQALPEVVCTRRSSPEYLVFAYHEIPKLDLVFDEDAWYSEIADETYKRCLATYRAAGWRGEAPAPDSTTIPEGRAWLEQRARRLQAAADFDASLERMGLAR